MATSNIYRDVNSLGDIREINRSIRQEMNQVSEQEELTELKKRADYLCALTYSPSWREKFGRKTSKFVQVAKEEDDRTTRRANSLARRLGFDAQYHPWRGN
jgi:hypothetical protein